VLKLTLTEKAQSDLVGVHEYSTARSGSKAANRTVIEMLEALEILKTFSGLGRASQLPDIRELVFNHCPYIAPYRVKNGQVQVLRILHQRTDR
jgi:plasmid stabilization system protein ParE